MSEIFAAYLDIPLAEISYNSFSMKAIHKKLTLRVYFLLWTQQWLCYSGHIKNVVNYDDDDEDIKISNNRELFMCKGKNELQYKNTFSMLERACWWCCL